MLQNARNVAEGSMCQGDIREERVLLRAACCQLCQG